MKRSHYITALALYMTYFVHGIGVAGAGHRHGFTSHRRPRLGAISGPSRIGLCIRPIRAKDIGADRRFFLRPVLFRHCRYVLA